MYSNYTLTSTIDNPEQLNFWTRLDEAQLLHDSLKSGYFSILINHPELKRKLQNNYLLSEMPLVLSRIDPRRDSWMSQAEFFRPNRRVVNLKCLSLCYADLDTYNINHYPDLDKAAVEGLVETSPASPELWANRVAHYCSYEGIPLPSYMISSGRGLQCKWLFTKPLPRQVLPRWDAVQVRLVNKLRRFGSDLKARDASRVLRIVDTVNTKTNTIVRPVWINGSQTDPFKYDFEYLQESFLELTRDELRDLKVEQHEIKALKRQAPISSHYLSIYSLWWNRVEDFRKLILLRDSQVEGLRELFVFWMCTGLLWSNLIKPQDIYREAEQLAREINPTYNWLKEDGHSSLTSLYSRAKKFKAGELIEWEGQNVPALYRASNQTLIDIFKITDSEATQLSTIIPRHEVLRRQREKETMLRRQQGEIERLRYEENSINRQKPWEAEGISRRTWYRRQANNTERPLIGDLLGGWHK